MIASSSFPGGFSFRHTSPFTLHAFVRIPPPFCRSFQCGNAYSFVSLLHSSIHAGHFHQRVMAGYEFHFVSFIIETESDQCVHSNNHLFFNPYARTHTHIYSTFFRLAIAEPQICAQISIQLYYKPTRNSTLIYVFVIQMTVLLTINLAAIFFSLVLIN